MCWPLLPCCCGALLSWSATTRRAQQRLHRCNFGELDKLPFYERNHPQTGFPCWLWFNAWTCVCVCKVGLCLTVGLLSLFLSVCLRVDDRGFFFGAVDERVWSALLVKTRESSLDLRSPPLPVGSTWTSCKRLNSLNHILREFIPSRFSALGSISSAPAQFTCQLEENTKLKKYVSLLQDLRGSSRLGGEIYARSKSRLFTITHTSGEVAPLGLFTGYKRWSWIRDCDCLVVGDERKHSAFKTCTLTPPSACCIKWSDFETRVVHSGEPRSARVCPACLYSSLRHVVGVLSLPH